MFPGQPLGWIGLFPNQLVGDFLYISFWNCLFIIIIIILQNIHVILCDYIRNLYNQFHGDSHLLQHIMSTSKQI